MATKGGGGGGGKTSNQRKSSVKPPTKKNADDEKTQKEDAASNLSKNVKPSFLKASEVDIDNGKENGNEEKEKDKEKDKDKDADKNEEISFGDKKDKRVKWCARTMNKPCRMVVREFIRDGKGFKPENYTYEYFKLNEEKNRYNDIICIDSTRVVLKNREEGKDYIHASWVTLPDGYKYISTQGPMTETIEDFWHMISTEKSPVIVMLCGLQEKNETKCTRYYPLKEESDASLKAGPFTIKYINQEKEFAEGITVHIYELSFKGEKQKITHYQCPVWTDHLAPLDAAPIVKFLREARAVAKESPITVHCSAGIGRTSTFIGIDYAAQKIKKNEKYALLDLVKSMRAMRFHAIQGPLQFLFMHYAIIEYFLQEEVITRKTRFERFYKEYKNTNIKYGKMTQLKGESQKKKKPENEKEKS